MNADFVRLDNFHIETIIGVLPTERTEPQPLVIALELELDLSRAAVNSDLSDTIDYAQLASEVAFILQAGRFKLLESAALALCHYLLTPPIGKALTVTAAKVTLSKPMALAGRAIPSVSIRRTGDQVTISDELHGEATALAAGKHSAADEALYDVPKLFDHRRVAPFGIELIDRCQARNNPKDLCD